MNWKGAAEFEPMLMPIDTLTPAPYNMRQGDIPLIADSLGRFGQLKPIVLDREGNIIAGNNVFRAAVEMLGWTHLAAVTADDLTQDDAVLFLLADNHASDQAKLNPEASQQVQQWLLLKATDANDEYAALFRAAADGLNKAAQRAEAPVFPIIDPDGMDVEFCCSDPECGYEWSGGQPAEAA